MRPFIIVQARLGSSRLPSKVLFPMADNYSMLRVVLHRCQSTGIPVVAALGENNGLLIDEVQKEPDVKIYVGPENTNNVLARYWGAVNKFNIDPIIRVTADCPFVCPDLIMRALDYYKRYKHRFNMVSIAAGEGASKWKGYLYPDGMDVECFSQSSLGAAISLATSPAHLEHPTSWIIENHGVRLLRPKQDFAQWKLSVDTPEDVNRILPLFLRLWAENKNFTWDDLQKELT